MENKYQVSLAEIINRFSLETIYMPKPPEDIMIDDNDVNRPGLQLAGYYGYFNPERIQIMGKMEHAFLEGMNREQLVKHLRPLFERKISCLILARELNPYSDMIEFAEEFCVPILKTMDSTSTFMASLIAYLNLQLAPRVQRHGTLMEVAGEGVLIRGESGVGKSETAIELLKRGHRFVADDAVIIKKVSEITLICSPPENIRHFMELRGIGIVRIDRLFGMSAVKYDIKLDLIVDLEPWNPQKEYDRMGLDEEYTSILGVKVPSLTIPVNPGRNLAIILEIAAINNRQKKNGFSAGRELMQQLGMNYEVKEIIKYDEESR